MHGSELCWVRLDTARNEKAENEKHWEIARPCQDLKRVPVCVGGGRRTDHGRRGCMTRFGRVTESNDARVRTCMGPREINQSTRETSSTRILTIHRYMFSKRAFAAACSRPHKIRFGRTCPPAQLHTYGLQRILHARTSHCACSPHIHRSTAICSTVTWTASRAANDVRVLTA